MVETKPTQSLLDRIKDNRSFRYAYVLFLCTLLPFVGMYIYVRSVYFTEKATNQQPSPLNKNNDDKVPDSDDTSASQDSSEHGSRSDIHEEKLSFERISKTDRVVAMHENSQLQKLSLKKTLRVATDTRKEECPLVPAKNGFWKSLADSQQVLKTIMVEDSSY